MNAKYHINLKKMAIVLFVVSILEPQFIVNSRNLLHYVFRLSYLFSLGYMFIYDIFSIKRLKKSREFYLVIALFISNVISTVWYGGVFSATSISFVWDRLCFIIALIFFLSQFRYNEKFIYKVFMVWGEIIIYINFITILLFPNGIWQTDVSWVACYFLGHKNQIFEYFFLPITCAIIYNVKFKSNIVRLWLMWGVTTISTLITLSKGSLATCVLLVIPISIVSWKSIKIKLSAWIPLFTALLINFLIVFIRIQNIFASFWDITFTGRTNIWDNAIVLIKNEFFVGYGGYIEDLNGLSSFYYLMSAHNGMLQLLLDGGVVLFLMWLFINIFAAYDLMRMRNKRLSCVMGFVFFSFYIHGIVEASYSSLTMYMLFIIVYNLANSKPCFNTKNRYKIQNLRCGEILNNT